MIIFFWVLWWRVYCVFWWVLNTKQKEEGPFKKSVLPFEKVLPTLVFHFVYLSWLELSCRKSHSLSKNESTNIFEKFSHFLCHFGYIFAFPSVWGISWTENIWFEEKCNYNIMMTEKQNLLWLWELHIKLKKNSRKRTF